MALCARGGKPSCMSADSTEEDDEEDEFDSTESTPPDDRQDTPCDWSKRRRRKRVEVPPIVEGLLETIEGRIPPLQNLTNGMNARSQAEVHAMLQVVLRDLGQAEPNVQYQYQHSKMQMTTEERTAYLDKFTTGELVRMLQYYLSNLDRPVFEPSKRLCQLAVLNDFIPSLTHKVNNTRILAEMQECCRSMDRQRLLLLAQVMLKLRLWMTKHVAYRVMSISRKTSEHVLLEASNFLGKLFSKCLIFIPAFLRASMIYRGGMSVKEARNLVVETIPEAPPSVIHRHQYSSADSDSIDNATLFLARMRRTKTSHGDKDNSNQYGCGNQNCNNYGYSLEVDRTDDRRDSVGTNYTALCSLNTENLCRMRISWVNMENLQRLSRPRALDRSPASGQTPGRRPMLSYGSDIRHSVFMLLICSLGVEYWHKLSFQAITRRTRRRRRKRRTKARRKHKRCVPGAATCML
ncbi:unnamed protein product [Schistocephalus solidus]|uniref:Rho-GAP domain-containing protein n=1 Tax=Schistocephalus solidus TaxID=70667 RepID=A0A183S912_SCHSO|nr:unnamed protein product [Schistocephalus solidus]